MRWAVRWIVRWAAGVSAAAALGIGCAPPAPAPELPPVRIATFTFPSLASVMTAVVASRGFDHQHGFRLEPRAFGAVAPYYAALARGEVDTAAGGPLVFQRLYAQGVPLTVTTTFAGMASLVVIARPLEVQRLEDLEGRTLAADMASSEYSILKLLADHQGIRLGDQIRVLQATPAVGRAHLSTGEAAAILTFEPTATLVLDDDPSHHVVFRGQEAWDASGLGEGWLLVSIFHRDFAANRPELVLAFASCLREAAEFIRTQPEAADQLVSEALALKPGILLRALREDRIRFEVHAAWRRREALNRFFRLGVKLGFSPEPPAGDAIFSPPAGFSWEQ